MRYLNEAAEMLGFLHQNIAISLDFTFGTNSTMMVLALLTTS